MILKKKFLNTKTYKFNTFCSFMFKFVTKEFNKIKYIQYNI